MSNPVSRWLAALRHDLSAKVRYRETTACAVGIIAAGSVTKCPFVHESLGCLLWAACSPPPLPPLSSLMPFSSGTRKFGRCARFVGDASTTSLSVHVEGGVASPAYVGEYLIYLTLPSFLPLGLPYDMHQYSIVRLTWKTFSMAQPSHPKSEMRSDRRI